MNSINNRTEEFINIVNSLKNTVNYCNKRSIIIRGDSLEIMKQIPNHSISLILTDPPYHSTKKKNVYGDTSFKEDEKYIEWMSNYAKEWLRILKPNGSLFCFCSSSMAAKLENIFAQNFNILSHVVWTKPNDPGFDGWKQKMNKESLRQWYDHSERILFAEPASDGNLFRSYCGNVLKKYRKQANISTIELAEIIGAYGKVNHGGAVANWEAGRNVPSKEQYEKLKKALMSTGKVKFMPIYEDLVRPFTIDKTKEFTDIWTFPNVRPYKGKHPAEKPIELLEHAIAATTFSNDIVLDCFAGSGSTAIASLKLRRYVISIEIDDNWYNKIKNMLKFIDDKKYKEFPDNYNSCIPENYQERLI